MRRRKTREGKKKTTGTKGRDVESNRETLRGPWRKGNEGSALTEKDATEEVDTEDAPMENNNSCWKQICEASSRFPCDPKPSH
mmetsp:Transcript_1999/g.12738  ORF Transcript_1999/g.12738 Transcript_1999/m.12738 type:complete len:83 (-) Transcript_1999:3287-3535(-)